MSKQCIDCGESMKREVNKCKGCGELLHKECALILDDKKVCGNCFNNSKKTSKEKIPMPDIIRRSHIDTYQQCPYKFYLEVIKGVPVPPNPYAQVGVDLHDLFDKLSCNRISYTKKHMLVDFNEIWSSYPDELFKNEELKVKMRDRAETCINNIYDEIDGLPMKPYSTEERIITSMSGVGCKISTTADRIDLINGELEVLDWKTGKVMYGSKLSSDLQAPLYIHAIRTHFEKPISRFTFYYLENKGRRVFEKIDEDKYGCTVRNKTYIISISEALREVKTIFGRIKSNAFAPGSGSQMFGVCKMCYYLESGICNGAEIESWRKSRHDNYKL